MILLVLVRLLQFYCIITLSQGMLGGRCWPHIFIWCLPSKATSIKIWKRVKKGKMWFKPRNLRKLIININGRATPRRNNKRGREGQWLVPQWQTKVYEQVLRAELGQRIIAKTSESFYKHAWIKLPKLFICRKTPKLSLNYHFRNNPWKCISTLSSFSNKS